MITHEINYSNAVLREYLDKLDKLYHDNYKVIKAVVEDKCGLITKDMIPNYDQAINECQYAICCIKTALQMDPLISNERLREIVNSLGKDNDYRKLCC